MNVYDWMAATESEPPLHEDNSREDPSHRPHTPTTDGDDRQHHGDSSPAGGGRTHEESEHHVEHTIQDPEMIADLTASNESIIEDVRKFFKIHNRGKAFEELDGNARASAAKIYKAIENTFASKEWVDKQTPITGKIKVGDLADRLNINDPVGTVKETFAINESFQEAIIAAQMPLVKELAQVTEKWNPNKLTDQNYEQLRDHLTTMKTMQEMVKKPTRSKTSLLDGKNKVDVAPSLNPEETLELGTTILTSMKKDHSRIVATNEEIHRLLDNIWEANYQIERQDGQSPGYNVEAWTKLMDTAFRKIPGSTPESLAAFRQFEDACVAAVIYMERSFKGGKGVAVEEFVLSNEGFLNAIRGLFKSKPKDLEIKGGVDKHNLKEVEATLLNDNWLKQQTFTEGNVTVRFPDAASDGNYKPLIARIEQELNTVAKYNAGKANAWLNPLKQAIDAIVSGKVNNISLEQAEKLREIADYDSLDFDVAYKEPNNFLNDNAEVELPALDAAGIKEAVNTLIKLVELRTNYCTISHGDMPGSIPTTSMHKILAVHDAETQDVLKDLHEEVSSIIDYFLESFYQDQYAYYDLVEGLAEPLLHWIKASITGVKYGNEAFADVGKH